MQQIRQSYQQLHSANVNVTAAQLEFLTEENKKLSAENIQIKKNLQNGQLLHGNLYKEWKELKETEAAKNAELERYRKAPKNIVSKTAFNALLSIASLLFLLALYNLFFNHHSNSKIISTVPSPSLTDTSGQFNSIGYELRDSVIAATNLLKNNTRKADIKLSNTEPSKTITQPSHKINNIIPAGNTLGLFKVKSKAYFYTEPDDNTRRNAFINHWNNSYATLKALDEKKALFMLSLQIMWVKHLKDGCGSLIYIL